MGIGGPSNYDDGFEEEQTPWDKLSDNEKSLIQEDIIIIKYSFTGHFPFLKCEKADGTGYESNDIPHLVDITPALIARLKKVGYNCQEV